VIHNKEAQLGEIPSLTWAFVVLDALCPRPGALCIHPRRSADRTEDALMVYVRARISVS
jgi:hypothetical protein